MVCVFGMHNMGENIQLKCEPIEVKNLERERANRARCFRKD